MRDPRVDPRRGDELRSANGCLYRVVQVALGSVRYRLIYPDGISWPGSVLLAGWRDFVDGLAVEKVA